MAILLGVLFAAISYQMPSIHLILQAMGGALAIAVLVLVVPVYAIRYFKLPENLVGTGCNILSWLVLFLLVALSYLPFSLYTPVVICSATVVGVGLVRHFRISLIGTVAAKSLASIAVFTALFAVIVFPRAYPPFSWEQALANIVYLDTYFYFSAVQMLIDHGVPSIAVDGLKWDPYHWGSFFLLARLIALLGMDVPHGFPAIMHLVFLPLFLKTIAALSLEVSGRNAECLPRVLWICFGAVIIYLSITNELLFISFSYLLSAILLICVVPVAFHVTGVDKVSVGRGWVLVLIFLAAITYSKISTGLILSAILGVLITRRTMDPRQRVAMALTVAGVFLIVFVLVFPIEGISSIFAFDAPVNGASVGAFVVTTVFDSEIMALKGENAMAIAPFKTLFDSEVMAWRRPFFFLIYPIFSFVYLYIRLRETYDVSWRGLKNALKDREIVDAEALVFAAVFGFVPAVLFWDGASTWNYFFDIQAWVALPLVCGAAIKYMPDPLFSLGRRGFMATILILLLAAPVLDTTGRFLLKRGGRFAAEIVETHLGLAGIQLPPRGRLGERLALLTKQLREPRRLWRLIHQNILQTNPRLVMLNFIATLKKQHGKSLAIYVPPANSEFWSEGYDHCMINSMRVPAFAGVVMIDGRSPLPCPSYIIYGLSAFSPRTDNASLSDEAVCRRAAESGLRTVYRLESLSQVNRNRLVHCNRD